MWANTKNPYWSKMGYSEHQNKYKYNWLKNNEYIYLKLVIIEKKKPPLLTLLERSRAYMTYSEDWQLKGKKTGIYLVFSTQNVF